jgi:hypothetical protein
MKGTCGRQNAILMRRNQQMSPNGSDIQGLVFGSELWMNPDKLKQEIAKYKWFHTIDLAMA